MDIQFLDSGWDRVLNTALPGACSHLQVICPFIKSETIEKLLKSHRPSHVQVITRFNLRDFAAGVSDPASLRLLLEHGAQVRGVKGLHAKIYIFGDNRVIVTSANLTQTALLRNHEFGFVAENANVVAECRAYFEKLWAKAGLDLDPHRISEWEDRVARSKNGVQSQFASPELGDEGTDVGWTAPSIVLPAWVAEAPQAFVKFFGQGHNRAERDKLVINEVRGSGSHWACTYPKGRRPRNVHDGAVMFMGCLARGPNDIMVYGRAIASQHRPDRDDATPADIQVRGWKAKWPHYIRVHNAEFVAGTLANGVSLNDLMKSLDYDAFASTQRNADKIGGIDNTDPRKAYLRHASVELSKDGFAWMAERLELAFSQHGKLSNDELAPLDWPGMPKQPTIG